MHLEYESRLTFKYLPDTLSRAGVHLATQEQALACLHISPHPNPTITITPTHQSFHHVLIGNSAPVSLGSTAVIPMLRCSSLPHV